MASEIYVCYIITVFTVNEHSIIYSAAEQSAAYQFIQFAKS